MEPAHEASLLLVDDDPNAIRVLSGMLSDYTDVRFATSGQDALRLARAETPDLILLDVEMPRTNGFEVCRLLKADRRLADVPVIFVTSHDGPDFEGAVLELGAADFIVKPMARLTLRTRVATQLRLRRLSETLARLATLDGLTGVANRQSFDETIRSEWLRATRAGQPVSLLMTDVDFFNAYNERYGRTAGDDCLCRLATVLQAVKHRPGDLLARYGGEAFVLLLPDTRGHGAQHVARQLIDSIDALALPHAASPVAGHVTVSVGVSCAEPPAGEADAATRTRLRPTAQPAGHAADLIRAADRALHAAKSGGRAQACFLPLDEVETPQAARRVAVTHRHGPPAPDGASAGAAPQHR